VGEGEREERRRGERVCKIGREVGGGKDKESVGVKEIEELEEIREKGL
jgi:hypothetical protein